MNANDQFFARDAKVDSAAVAPLPASRKIYVEGSRPDIRVPMREIAQTRHARRASAPRRTRRSPSTTRSGPYTDPDGDDRHPPRPAAAARALDRRARRHRASCPGRRRRSAARGSPTRSCRACASTCTQAAPRRAQRRGATSRRCTTRAAASSRRRWSSSPSARTEARRDACARLPEMRHAASIPGQSFGAAIPGDHHARVRARRGRARPRDHPGQHQPPGIRADDHRPQLPGEDQRQHRQLRGVLVDRRGSREDDVGDPLGRRHGDGPLHRQEHPRDARVDHPQLAGADRHGADLPGAGEGRRQGRGPRPGRSSATR